jgi:hypothetical protein
MDPTTANLRELEETKLQELADDPRNLVYRFVPRPKLDQVVPLSTVRTQIRSLWRRCKLLSEPNAAKRRQILCEENECFKALSVTHPLVFDRVTHPNTKQKDIDTLFHMCDIRKQELDGKVSNGLQKFQDYIVATYGLPEEEYKRLHPGHTIRRTDDE